MAITPIQNITGNITAPVELEPFIKNSGDDKSAGAISQFLNNAIALIFIIASIVFVFMILWGGWELITSGGDKERVANARKRLTYAFIGIIFFAIAFAIIGVIGTFTGFEFNIDNSILPPPPAT